MNLVIFDGGNYAVLSKKLAEIKAEFSKESVTTTSLKSTSFEQLLLELGTPSLFSEKRLVIVEDADEKKITIEGFPQDENLTVLLIFGKELGTNSVLLQAAQKKNARVFTFTQPQDKSVFQFLDYVGEKNTKAFNSFEDLYSQYGGQYLLTMLLYLFRKLVVPTNPKSFAAAKTDRQKKNFSQDQIRDCYLEVLQTDFLIKSGRVEEKTALLLLIQQLITT